MEFTASMKRNGDFRRAYSRGKSAPSPSLVVYCRPVRGAGNKLGITVSTKVGKAVTRNLVRRRIREIYRLHESDIKRGLDIVVVARTRAPEVSYQKLEKDFLSACGKLGILSGAGKGGEK